MINFEDDIREYNETVEKLQTENQALKDVLSRYQIFSGYSALPNLESDLKANLEYTEKLLEVSFAELLIPSFSGQIIFDENDVMPSDFVYTRVNKEFARFCNMEIKDIIGKTENELHNLRSPLWMEGILKATKILEPVDLRIKEPDGVFEVKITALKHDRFLLQFKTVNAETPEGKKLKENLIFTRRLVNALPVPFFYKNTEGRYVLCNDSYSQTVVGLPPEKVIGKTVLELGDRFSKEEADFLSGKDSQLLTEKEIQVYEDSVKCADGVTRVYIITKTLIKDSEGKPVGILGVMQNIDEIIKTRRELAESENRYKTLFNSISQPIIVADVDGNIVLCNSEAIELFEEEYDPKTGEKKIPAEALTDKDFIRTVLETGEIMTRRVSVVIKGEEKWFLSTLQPLSDSFGEKVVQIISSDITEIKRYQSELLKQKTHAEDSSNLKTIFLANIAHETRTPANIINGHIQMIQSGLHPEKLNTYLAAVYKNTLKLLDIIDDIVELSKIESGQIKLRHEICSINSILEDAFVYLSDFHEESGKKLELKRSCAFSEYESLIYADNQYISQVLKKLIANAVTFTQKGYIKIGASLADDKVIFFVEDSGIGIPEDKLNVIFERFRQADEGAARQYGGNGLGLAIANELVKRMGGVLEVKSEVSKGSVFSFSIPYKKAGM
ncbi:MAG: PAS domain-containing sensor histidine kinase [Bacteroidales bacterium]|nr:PAS domain-containing sensor histidine kinase [Bacteroidales bacterium]